MRRRVVPSSRVPWLLPILAAVALSACNQNKLDQDGDGFTELTGDCDDLNANVHPDAQEVCYNGIDDNCNGVEDEEGATSGRVWYADLDGDNYGDDGITIEACEQPENYASNKWDCNESDPRINPDAVEVCDYVDNDCDGQVDETSSEDAFVWYPDRDGDGYGDPAGEVRSCEEPPGFVLESGDCADLDPLQNPDAVEDCRTEADDDCDGLVNEVDAYGCTDWYADLDGDGFAGTAACLCGPDDVYTEREATDCDDTRADVFPGAEVTRRFAVEDCAHQSPIDIADADHTIFLGAYALNTGVVQVDFTGDGVDDVFVGTDASAPSLLVGPITDHTDLSGAVLTLPADPRLTGHRRLDAVADLDGDGLADLLQLYEGDDPSSTGVYAYAGTERGIVSLDDALWVVPGGPFVDVLPVAETADDAQAILISDNTDTLRVVALPSDGSAPSEELEVVDPLENGGRVRPIARTDLTGDGVAELVVHQEASALSSTHDPPEGYMWRIYSALVVLEDAGEDADAAWTPRHIYYGWSRLGLPGTVVVTDSDGDGMHDLLATEAGYLMESDSGFVAVFGGAQLAESESPYTLVHDADALYSGVDGDDLRWLVASADLDGDGQAAVFAQGVTTGQWMLDQFPSGHHSITTLARAVPGGVPALDAADANTDGVGDLTMLLGYPQTELRYFWGESP